MEVMGRVLCSGVLVFVTAAGTVRAEAVTRPVIDADELYTMEEEGEHAALEALLAGEQSLQKGDPAAAERLFAQAESLAPTRALPARRHCEALVQLDRRNEALASCSRALRNFGSPMDVRALSRALTLQPGASDEEVVRVRRLASKAVSMAPSEPWGYAALCDIARYTSDRALWIECTQQLRRVAPDHAETRQVVADEPLVWRLRALARWFVWATLALAILGSFAFRMRSKRRARAHRAAAFASVLALAMAPVQLTRAQEGPTPSLPEADGATGAGVATTGPGGLVDPEHPERSLASLESLQSEPLSLGYVIMELTDLADAAEKSSDFARAAKYYDVIARALPKRALATRKLSELHEKAGDAVAARKAARETLDRQGAELRDFERYVHLTLAQAGRLPQEAQQDLLDVTDHLALEVGGANPALLQCEVALRLENARVLGECSDTLARELPGDARTFSYAWAARIAAGDFDGARRVIAEAEGVGLDSAALEKMRTGLRQLEGGHAPKPTTLLAAGAVLALMGLGVVFVRRRRAALVAA